MPVLDDSLALTCQPAHTSCRARADVQHTRVSKCVFWRVVGKKLSEGPFSPSLKTGFPCAFCITNSNYSALAVLSLKMGNKKMER